VSRFLTAARQYKHAIQRHSRWFMVENTGQKTKIKNTDNTQTKHNPEKALDAKYSKTQLPCSSRLLQHSIRKWAGLVL